MKWITCCACLWTWALVVPSAVKALPIIPVAASSSAHLVCVVIRTYWKHGEGSPGSLERLIQSLRNQTHQRWEAQFVIMDSTPFENVTDILQNFQDERLWIFANWIGEEYSPKNPDGSWQKEYHTNLYDLTDQAARACHADTEWVLFTNGDNTYHKRAFEEIVKAKNADVVALDFYSRYQRPTGIPCERFKQERGAPNCKRNRMRWCHTDLGAVAYRLKKMVAEDLRFAPLEAPHRFTSQDALMAEKVVANQWRVATLEGIWDDRKSWFVHDFGGHCVFDQNITEYDRDKDIEVVWVDLAHDDSLSGFPATDSSTADLKNLTIPCLRPARNYKLAMMNAFHEECMEGIDEALYAEYMQIAHPLHPPWKRTEKSLQDSLKPISFGLELGESDFDIHDEL